MNKEIPRDRVKQREQIWSIHSDEDFSSHNQVSNCGNSSDKARFRHDDLSESLWWTTVQGLVGCPSCVFLQRSVLTPFTTLNTLNHLVVVYSPVSVWGQRLWLIHLSFSNTHWGRERKQQRDGGMGGGQEKERLSELNWTRKIPPQPNHLAIPKDMLSQGSSYSSKISSCLRMFWE